MKARMVTPHIIDRIAQVHRPEPERESETHLEKSVAPPKKGKGRKKNIASAAALPVEKVVTDEELRRDLAHTIVRCTTFYMLDEPNQVTEHSAAFLEALMRLWGKRGIDAVDVWREIDHRLQLGNLLAQINRDIPHSSVSTRKFWRPSSTKLP
ncbi:hypothetical protein JCM15831A_12460 [Asaia astilbis]|uniref:hypothetical protein n=1 Tax=Asaia astilbis TaxID=610244 RepID=UPI0004706D27|nr:hypothetical protein [Asaia astilbis]